MTGVFQVDRIEDDKTLGPLLSGQLLRGQLMSGMEALQQGKVLKIKGLFYNNEEIPSAPVGVEFQIIIRGLSYDFLKSLAGSQLEFSDLEHQAKKSLAWKPSPAA